MRNIFLIILFTFFSLKMFSQNKSERDTYYKLSTIEEKLDFLFEKIFNKQIYDFNELKKKNLSLENKLKSESVINRQKEKKLLNDSIDDLNSFILLQQNSLKQKNLEFSKLKDKLNSSIEKNKQNNESIRTLKSKIEAELKLVENYRGSLDPSLLILLERRAKNNSLPTSKLSDIINLNKVIFQAELLLSKPINTSLINKVYDSLDKITRFHSDWHKNKIYTLKILLENYCTSNSDLILLFEYIDEENLDEHNDFTLDEMISKRSKYVNYPFLSKELENKITDINYSYSLTKCN